jgi:hypothetical protein
MLPHLQALPLHEVEEAHEDVGLQPVGSLMPDRSHVQLVLLDTKGGFGLRELDVGLHSCSSLQSAMFERRR